MNIALTSFFMIWCFIKHKNKFTCTVKVRDKVVPVHALEACGELDV